MGDLAHRKIFPALYHLVERGRRAWQMIWVAGIIPRGQRSEPGAVSSVTLEVLHGALMCLCRLARSECSKIATVAGFGILLA